MIEYDKTIKHFEEGQIVKGTVIQVTLKEVIVDIGYKSEGAISVNEFKSPEEMTVGAEVDVLLESKENEEGMVVLSKEKVERARGWENILNNCEEGNIVKGRVTKKVKGGYMVDVGIDGFLPMSQAVLREFGGADNMVGKEMDFTIIKLNKMRRSIKNNIRGRKRTQLLIIFMKNYCFLKIG